MYFCFFSDGESMELAVELTGLRSRCEAVKPRLVVLQQGLMLYSSLQNHAYLIRHHINACV